MNKRIKIILGVSLTILVALATFFIVYVSIKQEYNLVEHNSIIIWGDEDFGNYNFEGEGTAEKPFLIQYYNISVVSQYGLYITNTSMHFIIQNCYIVAPVSCIFISNTAPGTVKILNNICLNGIIGIEVTNCDDVLISGNTCKNNMGFRHSGGIYLSYSDNVVISNNICFNNSLEGIHIVDSNYLIVHNNTCNKNVFGGIGLYSSSYVEISNNTCTENMFQIFLVEDPRSMNLTYVKVNFNFGIRMSYSFYSNITDNNCSDNGEYGISIWSSSNNIVENNFCKNNTHSAIKILVSDEIKVLRNLFTENNQSASVEASNKISFEDNVFGQNNNSGIELIGTNSSAIINNRITDSKVGISFTNSSACNTSLNLLKNNEEYGISVMGFSDNNVFHHNSFVDNNNAGISQAYDEGIGNVWYDDIESEGNYWNDHSGIGNYSIEGSSNSFDLYPLDEDPISTLFHNKIIFLLQEIKSVKC